MKKVGVNHIFSNWKRWHMNQVMILSLSLFMLGLLGIIHEYSSEADISSLKNELPKASVFYDLHGEVASKVSANINEGIPIQEVPKILKDAVIAIEDHRFYQHHGVDFIGITRALIRDIKARGMVEGGSTITQQLTKNTLLSSQKTLKRKIDELFLAMKIEREYSKPEILQMYLNQIYFGDGAWGIKQAARNYFAKEVSELSINESALLAGLIKAPSALNPYKNLEKAKERRNIVLAQMKKLGYISTEEYRLALNEDVVLNDIGGDPFRGKYPYYVDQVFEEAIKVYGLSQDELLTGGYQIYTELDPSMQDSMEKVYENDRYFPTDTDQMVQSGGVLMDPHSGGIRAIVGGRGEHTFRGYNRASHLKAQPGSTIKPLVVYTPALEAGWKITDMLKDEPMSFGEYEPSNHNHQYEGQVPMYKAVLESKNISAVWLLNEIGIEKGLSSIERFGIPLEKGDRNLSLALGGLERGVSPLEMAEAYSVFPNKGIRTKAHVIKKILDSNGNIVAKWEDKHKKVLSKTVAEKITTMLLGVVDHGTGKNAKVPGREIAGKTGSTQVPIEGITGVKDQWFVGYTPHLVGAVWVGYDKTDKDHYLKTTSSGGATVIFREIMKDVLINTEAESFHVPHIDYLIRKSELAEKKQVKKNLGNPLEQGENKWERKWRKQKEKWDRKWKDIGPKFGQ
jgi:penicillin-binding protein 2A